MMRDLAPQSVDQLVLRESSLLEELLHQRVIALGHLLDQLLAPRLGIALEVRRDVDDVELSGAVGVVLVRLHGDEIDHAAEVLLFADRQLDRHDVLAELLLQGLQRARERRAVAIHLVHDDEARQRVLLRELPHLLRRHFHAGHAADQHRRRIGDAQSRLRFHHEDAEAGRVEKVDLRVLPLHVGHGAGDGVLALDLIRIEVRRGRPVLHPPHARDRADVEQQL
jgi:hypothetical protein